MGSFRKWVAGVSGSAFAICITVMVGSYISFVTDPRTCEVRAIAARSIEAMTRPACWLAIATISATLGGVLSKRPYRNMRAAVVGLAVAALLLGCWDLIGNVPHLNFQGFQLLAATAKTDCSQPKAH